MCVKFFDQYNHQRDPIRATTFLERITEAIHPNFKADVLQQKLAH